MDLWHFGPGNGPGDTIVYEAATKTAWTGNFLPPAGFPTMLLEGGPVPYVRTLRRMRDTIDVATIVPGPPAGIPAPLADLVWHLHRLNVLATYRALEAQNQPTSY